MMAPQLEKVQEERKGQIRFVYKFFPLSAHPHGEIAARAGIAAWVQNKFWPMHHKMFQNREHLEQSDLDSYAKEIGLDLQKFHTDMQSKETNDRLARDKKLAESLEVRGTPTIYINGRDYNPQNDLNDWLNLEGAAPGAPPPPSPTIAPIATNAVAVPNHKTDAGTLDAAKK